MGPLLVHGRRVDAVFGDGDSLPLRAKPDCVFVADGAGHDQESVAGAGGGRVSRRSSAEVFETGEPLEWAFDCRRFPDEGP